MVPLKLSSLRISKTKIIRIDKMKIPLGRTLSGIVKEGRL